MIYITQLFTDVEINTICEKAQQIFTRYKKKYKFSKIYFEVYLIACFAVTLLSILKKGAVESVPLICMFFLGLFVYVLNRKEYKQTTALEFIVREFLIITANAQQTIKISESTLTIDDNKEINLKNLMCGIVIDSNMIIIDSSHNTVFIKCTTDQLNTIAKIIKNNNGFVFKLAKK